MKTIVLVKRGIGTVIMKQGEYSTGEKWYTITANGVEMPIYSAPAMNRTFKQYIQNGWTVKPEQRVASPDKPETPKPEKPETRFIFCKESRKIWATEYDRRKREALQKIINLKGQEYHDARIKLEEELKKEMRAWESENAVEVNKMLRQRKAEADAIQQ